MYKVWMAAAAAAGLVAGAAQTEPIRLTAVDGLQWYKGNTHTHTLWSDGDGAPELATKWYRDRDYHFLVLSDHNILSDGSVERWVEAREDSPLKPEHVEDLRELFGEDWVVTRETQAGITEMKLKTLPEVRERFEAEGEFLMIQGEEITCFSPKVHVNGINLREVIRPVNSASNEKSLYESFHNVLLQSQRYSDPMLGHLNHPNWSDGVPVQAIIAVPEARFFEVFNGHPGVRNFGSESRHMVDTDRIWDIVLAHRLLADPGAEFYGFGTDDVHEYHEFGPGKVNPGRGWVQVLAEDLTPKAITEALGAGRFYASSGVALKAIEADAERLSVTVDASEGVDYTVQFIGTREGFDTSHTVIKNEDGEPKANTSHQYPQDIGVVLAQTSDNPAVYEYAGDEMYVRAKVISSEPMENPFSEADVNQTAWTQPVVPARL